MQNIAYKHLEARLKIAELTVGQWLGLVAGVGLAITWGMYASPFGAYVTLFSAVYLGGIPAAAAFLASFTEFDLWLMVSSTLRWQLTAARYPPGPGTGARGYVIFADPTESRGASRTNAAELDLTTLWDC
jgi:hypothetical protein